MTRALITGARVELGNRTKFVGGRSPNSTNITQMRGRPAPTRGIAPISPLGGFRASWLVAAVHYGRRL